jgi:hypothetical protein
MVPRPAPPRSPRRTRARVTRLLAVAGAVGKFTSVAGQTSCTDCGLGTFKDTNGSVSSVCLDCSVDAFGPFPGSTRCLGCNPRKGQYQDTVGQSTCKWCPAGRCVGLALRAAWSKRLWVLTPPRAATEPLLTSGSATGEQRAPPPLL